MNPASIYYKVILTEVHLTLTPDILADLAAIHSDAECRELKAGESINRLVLAEAAKYGPREIHEQLFIDDTPLQARRNAINYCDELAYEKKEQEYWVSLLDLAFADPGLAMTGTLEVFMVYEGRETRIAAVSEYHKEETFCNLEREFLVYDTTQNDIGGVFPYTITIEELNRSFHIIPDDIERIIGCQETE